MQIFFCSFFTPLDAFRFPTYLCIYRKTMSCKIQGFLLLSFKYIYDLTLHKALQKDVKLFSSIRFIFHKNSFHRTPRKRGEPSHISHYHLSRSRSQFWYSNSVLMTFKLSILNTVLGAPTKHFNQDLYIGT